MSSRPSRRTGLNSSGTSTFEKCRCPSMTELCAGNGVADFLRSDDGVTGRRRRDIRVGAVIAAGPQISQIGDGDVPPRYPHRGFDEDVLDRMIIRIRGVGVGVREPKLSVISQTGAIPPLLRRLGALSPIRDTTRRLRGGLESVARRCVQDDGFRGLGQSFRPLKYRPNVPCQIERIHHRNASETNCDSVYGRAAHHIAVPPRS